MPELSDNNLSTRRDEILALSSIYDELILSPDELSGSLLIPVELDVAIPLISPDGEDKVRLLPDINFVFATGPKYPESSPPEISLQCSWLSTEFLTSIQNNLKNLWNKEICLFTIIDDLSEQAKELFGLEFLHVSSNEIFEIVQQHAETEESRRFNESIHFCEICLENKRGIDCFKLPRCGHVSCKVSEPF